MKNNTVKVIVFLAGVIILVAGLGFLVNKPTAATGKYDSFAQCLKNSGAQFYGAFWCPHCQAQEADLGMSIKQLTDIGLYNECSNADKSQTPICIAQKVESYPTWKFAKGITITSTAAPTICSPAPGKPGEAATCAQVASQYYPTYLFPNKAFSIKAPTPPTQTGDTWVFPADAATQGEVPLADLAAQTSCVLPQ